MDVGGYLRLLGHSGPADPSIELLRRLHAAHLRAVPFDNASIMAGEQIVLDPDALVDKVVSRRRGGFCYELNGAFAALLGELGFAVDLLQARVHDDNRLGPQFDHLCLRVHLDEPWLADVGFGHFFLEPLRLSLAIEQRDPHGAFRLVEAGQGADAGIDAQWRHSSGAWEPHYRFTPEPHPLEDFAAMCVHQQTSPSSPFTKGWICSRATPAGGVTYMGGRLVITDGGDREERQISDAAEQRSVLAQFFGIRLDADATAGD
ncbi:MAG TPA: arylamine N-acetyltransferase [Egibacteraceae bacterium]|nr:arylamine N-acetyltransferase [Egibacteraceae bacterium]